MILVVVVLWFIIVLSATLFIIFGQNPELNVAISCTWNNVLIDYVSTRNLMETTNTAYTKQNGVFYMYK